MSPIGGNHGEHNEIFLKAFLTKHYKLGIKLIGAPNQLSIISDLSFGPGIKVPEWSVETEQMLRQEDYQSLKQIFPKSAALSKADLSVNGVAYSVKFTGGSGATICNHTNRAGFINVCERVGADIKQLDAIVDEYWFLRQAGFITEDVYNNEECSPFRNHKEELRQILQYFLFKGTASRDSKFPADHVLSFSNPINPFTYEILSNEEAVDVLWDKIRFCMRSKKGMPTKKLRDGTLINTYDPIKHATLAPWVRYHPADDEFPRGALHIRL